MTETDWLSRHPAPVWQHEFEALCSKAVGADPVERESSERLLKKWANSRSDAYQELLAVIQTSQDPQSMIVAVLLCKNAVLKKWSQSQEELQLADVARGNATDSHSNIEVSQTSMFQTMNELTQSLIEVVLNRWQDIEFIQPPINQEDSLRMSARNQVLRLASLLTKKGLAHSPTMKQGYFYPIVEELLTKSTSALHCSEPLTHHSLICLKLLAELSRMMTVVDTVSLGISWEEYMNAKKIFEKKILLNLIPSIISLFQSCLLDSLKNQISLSKLLNQNPSSPLLFNCALELMEVFIEWDFSYTRCQTTLPNEIWFTPTSDWYSVIFRLPPFQSSNSTPPSTVLFDLLVAIYQATRHDPTVCTDSAAAVRFRKTLAIFTRSCQVRATRLEAQFFSSTAGGKMLNSQEKRIRLTQIVFAPLISSVGESMASSLFCTKPRELFEQSEWSEERSLAGEELQSLTLAFLRIVENPDVNLLALISNCPSEKIIEIVEWCFLQLVKITHDNSDEALIASIENISKSLALIAMQVADCTPQPPWGPRFNLAASNVSSVVLKETLHICSLREGEEVEVIEPVTVTGAEWNDEFLVGSPSVIESLKQISALGRCSSTYTARVLAECLEARSTNLKQALASHRPSAEIETQCDQLLWTLIFACHFVVEPSERDLDSRQKKVVPSVFLINPECQDAITVIFTGIINMIMSSTETTPPSLPPSIMEAALSVVSRFIDSYLLHTGRYGEAFHQFTAPETGSSALNGVVHVVKRVLSVMPHEPEVSRIAIGCLLRASSPLQPTVSVLWDCPEYVSLVNEVPKIALESQLTPLSSLPTKSLMSLCRAISASTSTSDYIKGIARQHEAELKRTGTLLTFELSQSRFTKLTTILEPVRNILIKLGEELQTKQQSAAAKHRTATGLVRLESESLAEASRTAELIRLFTMCTGLVRGVSDHRQALYTWLQPIVKVVVPAMSRTYMLYPDVLRSILKFLYRMAQSILNKLQAESAKDLLISTQTVAKSFVECYSVLVGELSVKGGDEDAIKNIGYLFKMLTFVMSQATCDVNMPQDWCPTMVVESLTILHPILQSNNILSNDASLLLSYLNLFFQLLELHPESYFARVNPILVQNTCKIIHLGLSSTHHRCQHAASEALGACVHYLIDQLMKLHLITDATTPPSPNVVDLFFEESGSNEIDSDPLLIFERHIAQMGVQVLIAAIATTPQPKQAEFYSDVMFDILNLLATKAYHLARFFEQFSEIYSHEAPLPLREVTKSSFMKAADPILREFVDATRQAYVAVNGGQTISMQKIKYSQFRNKFRQRFLTLILECRIAKEQQF